MNYNIIMLIGFVTWIFAWSIYVRVKGKKYNHGMLIGFGTWIFAALIVALRLFFPSHFLLQYFPYSLYGYLYPPLGIEEVSYYFYGILLTIAADWVIIVLSIYFIIAIFWKLFFFCNRLLQQYRK